ncbi:MAG: 23S rRNA (uracil(1939)-C(5))-methyltransferase RlmD [Adlercreutzia equolifaciens]
MEPYDEDAGTGFVRHAVVRVGHTSGEVLVTVVTNGDQFPASKAFCRELARRVPEVTTVVQNVNTRQTNVILGDEERVLYGPGFILDTLCGLSFRISSQSFYQVNATQTEALYDEAVRLAHLTGTETVVDAYCGTGTIGLVAAKRGAARVVGVDSVEAAIRDARGNARHNGVENAEFVAEDATRFMERLAAERAAAGEAPSQDGPLVLLMDPPRAGSTPAFLKAAAALGPERIVYISCNPKTQARDVRQLVGAGYIVRAVRPVDMFPHTDHVESIVMLERSHD